MHVEEPFFVPSASTFTSASYILRNSIFNYMRFMATGSSDDFRCFACVLFRIDGVVLFV